MVIALLVFLLIVLIGASGCLSASETALFSLSPLQLKFYQQSKSPRLALIAHLMERPRDVLVTILILNILANILVQNTVASIFAPFSGWFKVGLPLALTLVFGEVLPKSIAIPNNAKISYAMAPWISRIARWLGPLRRRLTAITGWISRFFFFILSDEEEISPDELRHVLRVSEESGVILEQEGRLIGGALDLRQVSVKERMRPREEILSYDIQEPLEKLVSLLADQQITRVPVCDGDLEKLLGIVSARRFFFSQPLIHASKDLLPILKKPYFVPETTKASTLLINLRERGESMAVVVDEYGSISGLITQEDLIETVVGEISDLRDEKNLYTRSGEDVIIASGKMELDEFKRVFGLELESRENSVTLGGWLIEQMGDIPQTGAKYATDQFLFYVLSAEPNRVRRIYVRRFKTTKKREV
jgi:CBS domain containing-hemolysin-like protein